MDDRIDRCAAPVVSARAISPSTLPSSRASSGLEQLPPIDQFLDAEWPRRIGATIELLQMGIALVETGAVSSAIFPEISVHAADRERSPLRPLGTLPARTPPVLRALLPTGAPLRPAVSALLDALRHEVRAASERKR